MPAVGLGARPPSIISTSTDEGGFNEPSPEIKAKLKPAYTFELDSVAVAAQPAQPDLHYVDVSHRLNPDGSEGENSYIEPEMYSIKSTMMMDMDGVSSSRGGDGEKVVYATIKPEVAELHFHNSSTINANNHLPLDEEDASSLYVSTVEQRSFHHHTSPQVMLDPTRPTLMSNGGSRQDSIEDKRLPDLPVEPTPPPRPPLPKGPPLDMTSDEVEYVDASDGEEEEGKKAVAVVEEKRNGVVTPAGTPRVNGLMNGSRKEDVMAIPESMTADEAERLLSSR